jgi:hypothetical protein
MVPKTPAQLTLIIEAAKSPVHNPNNHESPWYEVYDAVLNQLIDHNSVSVAPQLRLSHTFFPDAEWAGAEPKPTTRAKIPDFVLMHTIVQNFQPPNEPAIRGIRRRPLLLIEIKPFSPGNEDAIFLEGFQQVRRQAKAAFATYPTLNHIYGMVCVGDIWSWGTFRRGNLSPVTEEDATHEPESGDEDEDEDEMNLFAVDPVGFEGRYVLMTAASSVPLAMLRGAVTNGL